MNKILVPVISLAAVGGIAFGVIQMNSAGDTKEQVDKLGSDLDQQKKALSDALAALNSAKSDMNALTDRNDFLQKELDKAKEKAKQDAANAEASAGIASAPVESDERRGQEAIRNFAQALDRGFNNPEARNAMRSGQARGISRAYEGVYKKLNLSAEDQQVVSDLLSERNTAAFDKARKLFGGKNDDASISAARKEILDSKAESDAKLRGVLGDQKFNELATYEKTVGEQRTVDSFSRNQERKGAPLEPEKKDALLSIMQQERLKIAGDDIPDIGGGPGMSVMLSEAEAKAKQVQEDQYEANVLAQAARAGLTPDQIQALQGQFKEKRDQQALGRAFGRAFLGGDIGGAIRGATQPQPQR